MLLKRLSLVLLLVFASLQANAAVPDIKVRDTSGKIHNVNQFIGKGKWTVVMFWAHNCPICNQEVEQMTFFQDDHRDKDATVLGISMDGFDQVEKSKAFIKRHDLNFPNMLIELSSKEFNKFGGGRYVGTPTFYLYNPAGELVAKNIGPVSPEDIEKFIKPNAGPEKG